jgi:hypothetical protein
MRPLFLAISYGRYKMITYSNGPTALFGGPLLGSKLMRFIYMDEAGTSADEPLVVEVALIVEADQQVHLAERLIDETLGAVPVNFRDAFVFHADQVWNDRKYRDCWAMADRLAFLKRMMGLRLRLRIPLVFAFSRKPPSSEGVVKPEDRQRLHQGVAFDLCVGLADKFIRDRCGINETAAIVHEQNQNMDRVLRSILRNRRLAPVNIPGVAPTAEEKRLGYIKQETDHRVERIRNSIFFARKDDDPLLCMADACAFGLRRYFTELEFGAEFGRAVLGQELIFEDWRSPLNGGTY